MQEMQMQMEIEIDVETAYSAADAANGVDTITLSPSASSSSPSCSSSLSMSSSFSSTNPVVTPDDGARLAEYERLKALGTDKFKDKKWAEAIKFFDLAAAVIYSKGDEDPTRQGYYVICKSSIAQCCINLSNFKGAIKYSTEALSIDPENVKALYRRGLSRLELDQFYHAEDDFKSLLALYPKNKAAVGKIKKSAYMHNLVMCIIDTGDMERIRNFLEIGADIDFMSNDGDSPLWIASENGDDEVVEYLITKGADVHKKSTGNREDHSLIMWTSMRGDLSILSVLLSKGGANVHDKSEEIGYDSLMLASVNGHIDVVDLLLSEGASTHNICKVGYGRSCHSMARDSNYTEVLFHLNKWPTIMAVIMLLELCIYNQLDVAIIDLYQFIGVPHLQENGNRPMETTFMADEPEDYNFDEDEESCCGDYSTAYYGVSVHLH